MTQLQLDSLSSSKVVAKAPFHGYTWGHEYLQVNPPTCDGVVGSPFICLPHEDADDDWAYGRFEGGRAGWLPARYLEPYVPSSSMQNPQQRLEAANLKIQLLEEEVEVMRRQVRQAGIQKHEF